MDGIGRVTVSDHRRIAHARNFAELGPTEL